MSTNDLDTLYPDGKTVKTATGDVVVRPLLMPGIAAMTKAVKPALADVRAAVASNKSWAQVATELAVDQIDVVLDIVRIGAGVKTDSMLPDDFLSLLIAVLEVNADFFSRRVVPILLFAMARANDTMVAMTQAASGGDTSTQASSQPATDASTSTATP
jgi:hypothetical protein